MSIKSDQFLYDVIPFDCLKIALKSNIEQCQLPKKKVFSLSSLVAEMNIEHQNAKSLSAIAL